eukprot:CAMPEP_0181337070 /NCGR_PEP_ID=MMETSP1101-20121128/27797_1 /TAXON_ID=46948 /ORGANISM="Rhodomonas abbreviata, Strain Caron Lab Isolate" /LENGTH=162 /DNA_ID=CAMNT_0023447489 /DNA_START=110 /DNA_END=594 /DNA_ORIENTATION=-
MAARVSILLVLVSLASEGTLVAPFVISSPGLPGNAQCMPSSQICRILHGSSFCASPFREKDSAHASGSLGRQSPGVRYLTCTQEKEPAAAAAPSESHLQRIAASAPKEKQDEEPENLKQTFFKKISSLDTPPRKASLLRKPTPRLQKLKDLIFKKEAYLALT